MSMTMDSDAMDIVVQLPCLQIEQQRHDEIAHRDILSLSAQDRVKHMVLHFAKYAGHFADMQDRPDSGRFVATLVDTFIICLACANSLNLKLSDVLSRNSASSLPHTENPAGLLEAYFVGLTKITGSMAKACESLDHFERFDYHGTLECGVSGIAQLCIDGAVRTGIDLVQLTRARWDRVERRFRPPLSQPEPIRLASRKT